MRGREIAGHADATVKTSRWEGRCLSVIRSGSHSGVTTIEPPLWMPSSGRMFSAVTGRYRP